MNWPGFRQGLWSALISEANKLKRDTVVTISGSDLNEDALSAAQQNANQAGVKTMIQFYQHDAFSPAETFDEGLLICNPPYGERLAAKFPPAKLLKKLAQQLKDSPKVATAIILPHDKQMPQNTQLNFSNGGLDVALYSTKKSRTP